MKKFDIVKPVSFSVGFKDGANYLFPVLRKEFIVATVDPMCENYSRDLIVELLFKGSKDDMSDDLADSLLIAHDTSYNPSRPFRWYKYITECADTDSEDSIIECRKESLNYVLNEIDNPEIFYIYKMKIR